jgi:hypothetical protein
MKKITFAIVLAVMLMVSCSSTTEEENTTGDSYATTQLSGTLYNHGFTLGGGYARSINLNGVDSFYIYMVPDTTNGLDCDDDTSIAPIWIAVPAAVGEYVNNDFTMQFKNISNGGFEGAPVKKIEITSISPTMVKGRIRATGFDPDYENFINGIFELQYCPL